MSLLIEANPNFYSVVEFKGCIKSRRYESDAIYLFTLSVSLSQKVEDQPFVNLFMILVLAVDLKDETTSLTIFWVFPGRRNTIPEIIDRIYFSLFSVNEIAEQKTSYLFQYIFFYYLLSYTKKFLRSESGERAQNAMRSWRVSSKCCLFSTSPYYAVFCSYSLRKKLNHTPHLSHSKSFVAIQLYYKQNGLIKSSLKTLLQKYF